MVDDYNSSTGGAGQDGSSYERSHDAYTTVRKAKGEYRRGVHIPEGHPVAAYLASRGLWPLAQNEHELLKAQFYDVMGETEEDEFSGFWLCAPLLDEDANIVAIQRTSINKQGEKVAVAGRNDRITIGEAYGACIRLIPAAGDVLHVAEGLEDAMSVARLAAGAVCWATCGRRGMEELSVPPAVKEVHICADNDEAGLLSAQVLAMRLVLQGKGVRILTSPIAGEDPNDALRNGSGLKEILHAWVGRLKAFAQWRSLSSGEIEGRQKALAKADQITLSAVKSEWFAFIKASRPRRALVAGGVADSIEKAAGSGYRHNREGIASGDIINAHIALQRIGLTARLDMFDMALYLEPASAASPIVAIPGAPLHGFAGAVRLRDEMLPPLITFIALKDGVTFSDTMLLSALRALGHAHRHHSMQDWLKAQPKWDGVPRVEFVLREVFGVEDNPLTRWGSAALFVGQALRIMQPGAKVDVMPVLVGTSGYRKSTFVKAIAAGGPDKFTDAPLNVADSRKVLEQTLGKTVVEWAEMEGATKADWESLKAFLSRTADAGRLAYGRENTEMPRGYINVGTVNDMRFIRSEIGSRRFLPLVVQRLGDFAFLHDNVGQLWAEALSIVASLKGELAVPPELWNTLAELRAQHTRRNPYAMVMGPFLEEYPNAVIKSADVAQFLIGHGFKSVPDNEIGEAMRDLGFQRPTNAFEFGSARWRGWYRGERPTASDVEGRLLRVARNDAVGRPSFLPERHTMAEVEKASAAAAHAPTPERWIIKRKRGPVPPKRSLH